MDYRFKNGKNVFLILNYKTYWETLACVQSIFDTVGKETIYSKIHEIVIVDNGSNNESFEVLSKAYLNIPGIHIIQNRCNLGFAKGNNVGFTYAKYQLNAQFITMINSDIILNDSSYIDKIISCYDEVKFAVAGPNVVNASGELLNPAKSTIKDINDVNKTIKKLERRIKLCKYHLELPYIVWTKFLEIFLINIHKIVEKPDINHELRDMLIDTEDSNVLHGCFLIFSDLYIEMFDGLYDATFLYFEETLLRLRCNRYNLKMYYISGISAIHNESRTEKYINNKLRERHLLRYVNSLNSLNVVKCYMMNKNEK